MPIRYKIAIMQELKKRGYSSTMLRRQKIFGELTMQNFRSGIVCYGKTLETLCKLLQCQPGDILEYVPEKDGGNENE